MAWRKFVLSLGLGAVHFSGGFPISQDSWPDHGSISLHKLGKCHMALRIKILSGNIRGIMGVQRWHLNSGGHDAKSSDRSKGPVARKRSRSDWGDWGDPLIYRFSCKIMTSKISWEYQGIYQGIPWTVSFGDSWMVVASQTSRVGFGSAKERCQELTTRCSMKSWLHMNLYVNLYVLWILSDSMVCFRCFHLF